MGWGRFYLGYDTETLEPAQDDTCFDCHDMDGELLKCGNFAGTLCELSSGRADGAHLIFRTHDDLHDAQNQMSVNMRGLPME